MPYIRTVPIADADGDLRELYDAELAADGHVTNMLQLFSLRPGAWQAWTALRAAVRGPMDLRRYELATLAASRALRCAYCVGAHAAVLESEFYDRSQLEAMMRDYHAAGLDDVDVAVMEFAEKVARHAWRVAPEDVDRLRGHGLTDAEILDVTLTSAMRCFFSNTLEALGAEPDEEYLETAALLELVELRASAP